MSDVNELTKELIPDPEFKKEYEALAPEMYITRAAAITAFYQDAQSLTFRVFQDKT